MSRLPKFVGIALLGVVAFVAGALVAIDRGWMQPTAVIDIENRSGQGARRLEIKYEGSATSSTTSLPAPSANGTIRFPFYVRGEGAYSVNVVLNDGTSLSSGKRYVQSGHRTVETIRESKIEGTPARLPLGPQ
jgi:hypothetical protein